MADRRLPDIQLSARAGEIPKPHAGVEDTQRFQGRKIGGHAAKVSKNSMLGISKTGVFRGNTALYSFLNTGFP
jgi:hypothetical protein